jgi:hypothetical protein
MKKLLLLLPIIGLIFSSCTSRVIDYTLLSTKNVNFEGSKYFMKAPEPVKGKDTAVYIFVIPTSKLDIKEAINDAIEQVPGCVALADVVIYQRTIPLILINTTSYIVKGTPIIDKRLLRVQKKSSSLPSNYIYGIYNEKKKGFEISYISKEEYEKLKKKLKIN